jgi:hypothetical protein
MGARNSGHSLVALAGNEILSIPPGGCRAGRRRRPVRSICVAASRRAPQKPDAPVDEALSVNVESLLNAAGLPLTWMVDLKKQYVARITVGDCVANGLEAFHAPTKPPQPDNPHHGLIYGLVELHDIDEDRYERTLDALAKTSTIVQF